MLSENIIFSDLENNSDVLWSLLLFSGYLTAVKVEVIVGEFHCLLQTPNQEVTVLYRKVIRNCEILF